jgi:hypothetical protein
MPEQKTYSDWPGILNAKHDQDSRQQRGNVQERL